MSEIPVIERTYREEWLLRLQGRENHPFVIDGDRSLSFQGFYEKAVGLANALSKIGVASGADVAIRATRSLESLLYLHALMLLGAKLWLLDAHLGAKGFLANLHFKLAPDWIISNERFLEGKARNGGWEIAKKGEEFKALTPVDKVPSSSSLNAPKDFNCHQAGLIIFTSGSTGTAKGAFLSQFNMLNHIENFADAYDARDTDHDMQMLPLHHVYGLCLSLMAFRKGYWIDFPEDISFPGISKEIIAKDISILNTVPTYALGLADYIKKEGISFPSLRLGCLAGAPVTVGQFSFIEETLGMNFYPVYGETECIGISALRVGDPQQKRAATVGHWLKMGEYRIADENDNPLPDGKIGEVQLKSPAMFEGYYKDEAATKAVFTADGYLHSGDLGYLDEGKYLHLTGRKKAIIIKNGNNISAEKVEDALESLPFVESAAVVGRNSESKGEEVCAYIVLKQGEQANEEKIRDALAGSLFKNEIPDVILFGEKMLLNSSLKKDKPKIKALFGAK